MRLATIAAALVLFSTPFAVEAQQPGGCTESVS
jgi:hypothetical protein